MTFRRTTAGTSGRVPTIRRTLAGAVRADRAEIRRSERLLDGGPGGLPGEIRAVRDVVLHVIDEVARHGGHADIARELLDGRSGLGRPGGGSIRM